MKKIILIIGIAIFSLNIKAQDVIIELPETYELSNIILALTEYGRTDQWEVLKGTKYYQDVLDYFEPVKNHPLLDSVNYSRAKWEDYLSFRTDAYVFEFDANNKLKRKNDFSAVEGHTPFDKNIDLINDFVEKSNFRKFYNQQKETYNYIVQNYKDYYYIDKSFKFLDDKIGKPQTYANESKYVIVLSPLTYRMNCHRDIDENTAADFVPASKELVNGINENNRVSRIVENHTVFTEIDHGYVNPISDKYRKLIAENFNNDVWDNKSGYPGISCFNEYMTWAVYDIFIKELFPEVADSIAIQWQYQNASRGFFAQNVFSEKVAELYAKKGNKPFETIYEPLLKWCKKEESKISLPTLINIDEDNFVKTDLSNIQLTFSERMNIKETFVVQVVEYKNQKSTGKDKFVEIKNAEWTNNGKTIRFKLDTEYDEFVLFFNFWGHDKPLKSNNGIFLYPQSYVLLKK
jgi:hypothetical protein